MNPGVCSGKPEQTQICQLKTVCCHCLSELQLELRRAFERLCFREILFLAVSANPDVLLNGHRLAE